MRMISAGLAGLSRVLLRETVQPLELARSDRAGSAATEVERANAVAAAIV